MDPLLGVFRNGKLTRVASVKDIALRRAALRVFAEPQSHVVVDIPSDLVSANIACVDTNIDPTQSHFRCAVIDVGDNTYVSVYATNSAAAEQTSIDLTWHALAVSSCAFTTQETTTDMQVTLLEDDCLALTDGKVVYRSRASVNDLAHTLPLATHDDTQLFIDEIMENGGWQTEKELQQRIAYRSCSAIKAESIMRDLKHVMRTPGFTSCFSVYDQAYAKSLRQLMRLSNEKTFVQDKTFCNELFAHTTSVMVRAMAMPVPDSAFHPTQECSLTERVFGGTDCQPHKWLRWYMRVHARLQRDFQSKLGDH